MRRVSKDEYAALEAAGELTDDDFYLEIREAANDNVKSPEAMAKDGAEQLLGFLAQHSAEEMQEAMSKAREFFDLLSDDERALYVSTIEQTLAHMSEGDRQAFAVSMLTIAERVGVSEEQMRDMERLVREEMPDR